MASPLPQKYEPSSTPPTSVTPTHSCPHSHHSSASSTTGGESSMAPGYSRLERWRVHREGRDVEDNPLPYSTEDAEVTVIAEVGGNGFNGPSTFTFRIADGKVAEMRITA